MTIKNGQLYAALSGVKSLRNLYIEGQATIETFSLEQETKNTILFKNITNRSWIFSCTS